MIKVFLLDDEIEPMRGLQMKILSIADDIEIVAMIDDPEKALHEIKLLQPDILFLDIDMPGMNGFQFLEKLKTINFEIIFVTAFNQYTLKAMRAGAIDYLLKPVDNAELVAALQAIRIKLDKNKPKVILNEQFILAAQHIKEPLQPITKIALSTNSGIKFIHTKDILRIEALNNYSAFYLVSCEKIVVSKTLKEYETILQPPLFFRCSRSFIINLNFITELKKSDEKYDVIMSDGTIIYIPSMRRYELIRIWSQS